MHNDIFYHGSGILFEEFNLEHILDGAGKAKFGYGVYVTSSFPSAAHYSGANPKWTRHYVYTLSCPARHGDNHISYRKPVNEAVAERAAVALGHGVPAKAQTDGKLFRKYLAEKVFSAESKIEAEMLAARFLLSIGVDFIEWPYNWKVPDAGNNRAILDPTSLEILRIDEVQLDSKSKLIPESVTQIK